MFDFLKPGKGFAITFNSGNRVEIDFGPLSHSEKKNASQKECDHSPASRNCEFRFYRKGEAVPSFIKDFVTPDELPKLLEIASN